MSPKYTKWKNSNADDYIFYGSIFMKPPEKANLDTESSLRVTQGEEESRINCKLAWENLGVDRSVLKLKNIDDCIVYKVTKNH